MIKLKVKGDFFEVEVEGATQQEVWQQAAFWHALPTVCPVDGSPTRFGYANRGGYDFYFLASTGSGRVYEYPFGQGKKNEGLFPGQYDDKQGRTNRRWVYWDAEANRGEGAQVIVWENGRLLTQPPAQPQGKPQPQPSTQNGKGGAPPSPLPSPRPPAATTEALDPFDDPLAGVAAEPHLDYGEIAERLTGSTKALVDWAHGLHSKETGKGPASKEQMVKVYRLLNRITDGSAMVVLSVLCRRYVHYGDPCSAALASALLNILDEKNPKYKPAYPDCLRAIADAVTAWRAEAGQRMAVA